MMRTALTFTAELFAMCLWLGVVASAVMLAWAFAGALP